jgi:hypothetical protein
MITTEVLLSALSVTAAISSGYMLYKTNISKDKVSNNKNLLEAESEFRENLLNSVSKLSTEVDKLKDENDKLKNELCCAVNKIEDLTNLLEKKIDKTALISTFLKYLPNPAWLRTIDSSGQFKFSSVNTQYCNFFNVSEEYIKGCEDHPYMNEECKRLLNEVTSQVLIFKKGVRIIIPLELGNVIWHVFKFPVIEKGKIVAIGGLLIDCCSDGKSE